MPAPLLLLLVEELLLLELELELLLALRAPLLEPVLELLRLTLLLPLRLFDEPLVLPLGRLLLELLPTRLLELLVPLGRLLVFGRLTLLPLLGVLPLPDPLPLGLGLSGLTLLPLLFGADALLPPLLLLPPLMLPALGFGLTVAEGATSLLSGFGVGSVHALWLVG